MQGPDVLSEIFSTLRLNGSLYFRARLSGAYAVEVPRERRTIRFHLVRQGACLVSVPGERDVELGRGDLIIIPDGAPQVLSAGEGIPAAPLGDVLAKFPVEDGMLTCAVPPSPDARFPSVDLLCGYCVFDEAVDHPVLKALPRSMVLRSRDLSDVPCARAALDLLAMEAEQEGPGMIGVVSRLIEIVFLQAVRGRGNEDAPHLADFTAALRDSNVSEALQAIHRDPGAGWTIESLASAAGMSRARFADRFAKLVGVPPINYLAKWRLMKGRALLAETSASLEDIAVRCGYASAASFSRRFKQEFGLGPGAYRKTR
ncbi:HTH-type transcriptional regulator YesS [Pseudodesulfovibrio hydrargyri]|uniref:HTH-type transcriptional regulator YesS n=1 Tax=Pseudodesulfovibrio hydrargyri TaxID=2125990 RepID=A0A1J5N2G4_9BACT|nr:AraC family transcriptional regulator [Pseudodesulfovibrio hydrargyri]OIQ48992.1 HTH-type transcriptional regulator YesS [Pseudodesulfovibrio hydrargyri]